MDLSPVTAPRMFGEVLALTDLRIIEYFFAMRLGDTEKNKISNVSLLYQSYRSGFGNLTQLQANNLGFTVGQQSMRHINLLQL